MIQKHFVAFIIPIGLCVVAPAVELLRWARGEDPSWSRALFIIVLGSAISLIAYRGHLRQGRETVVIPEPVQAMIGFIVLASALFALVLVAGAPFSRATAWAFFGSAGLTGAIVARRSVHFLWVGTAVGAMVGLVASPLLVIFTFNADVDATDALIFGALLGATFALPTWWMFRRAGEIGPKTLTIALLIAALLIPPIISTAYVRGLL